VKNPRMAKFYVSAIYRSIKKEYWNCILSHVMNKHASESENTHTHTHTREKFSHEGSITNGDRDQRQDTSPDEQETEDGEEDTEGEDYEDGSSETDEGYSEGTGTESDEEDDWKGHRE